MESHDGPGPDLPAGSDDVLRREHDALVEAAAFLDASVAPGILAPPEADDADRRRWVASALAARGLGDDVGTRLAAVQQELARRGAEHAPPPPPRRGPDVPAGEPLPEEAEQVLRWIAVAPFAFLLGLLALCLAL
jgi:hypothetical protein